MYYEGQIPVGIALEGRLPQPIARFGVTALQQDIAVGHRRLR